MNISEFVDKFNDIIPYKVIINVGDKNKIVNNKFQKSWDNFKGKGYRTYEKVNGEYNERFISLDEVSLPIDITVIGNEIKGHVFRNSGKFVDKNPIKYTNKDCTHHDITVFDEGNKRIGDIDISLNKSGDIRNKRCTYYNRDRTHLITHSIDYSCLWGTEELEKRETISYEDIDREKNLISEVIFYKFNSKLTGIKIEKKRLKKSKEIMFSSITDIYPDMTGKDTHFILSKCFYEEHGKSNKSFENYIIEEDLLEYNGHKKCVDRVGIDKVSWYIIDFLSDEANNLLSGYMGKYSGHTLIIKGEKILLYIHTTYNDRNYYYEINLTGTNPFVGTNPCFLEEQRDKKYFDAMKNASRKPKFISVKENNKEELVSTEDFIVTDELKEEFNKFKSLNINSFEKLSEININKTLNKKLTNN